MGFFSLSLLLVIGASWGAPTSGGCTAGQELLEFTFFLDSDSLTENGWTLTCDSKSIWKVPMGTLRTDGVNTFYSIHTDSTKPYVKEQTCISTNETCHFTFQDLYGDGLQSPGSYSLVYGAKTIGVSRTGKEFYENTYCFGANCPVQPQEIPEPCSNVSLYFRTDYSPQQSSVSIECDGVSIFSKSDFRTPMEVAEFKDCIPNSNCCVLTIEDSGFNGINPSQGGNIFVEWDGEIVFQYDDSNAFKFHKFQRPFGMGCAAQNQTTGNGTNTSQSHEKSGKTNHSSPDKRVIPANAKVAVIVLGCVIAVLGFLLWRTSTPGSRSSSSTGPGSMKDLEIQSTGSQRTDPDDES